MTMDTMLFLKAALIGLSIAAPVGPVGLLCMQRTLAHGARIGFCSGLGAAVADACYGAIGAFGLTAVMQSFVALATPLAVGGAGFLGWLGLQLWRTPPAAASGDAPAAVRPDRAFVSVFALTLANPLTILSFVAVFAALGGKAAVGRGEAALMVLGIFAGSALWWLALALGVARLRQQIGTAAMGWINRAAGMLLLGCAAWQLASVVT